ncbi:MAG: choice-of-anchor J domain-containing protein [Clostridia bacterium]|nr:choice-of-anchor J domain-containing protein [Clostridia bacterium]
MKKLCAALLSVFMLAAFAVNPAFAAVTKVIDSFDAALNAEGGGIDFENDAVNPWLLCEDAGGNAEGAVCSNIAGLDDTETGISFTVEMAAGERLSFSVKCSTEAGYDVFRLYDNDAVVMTRSGETQWKTESYTATEAGSHSFRLVYSKDGSAEEGEDTVWLDDVAVLPVDPNAPTLNDVMNADGNANNYIAVANSWVPYEYLGMACAKSNIEYTSDGVAEMYTECYMEEGATLSFYYAASSEDGCDELFLSVINLDTDVTYNDVFSASGEVEWSMAAWNAPATANYRLVFTYEKDGSVDDGNDTVYLADCNIPRVYYGDVKWSTSFESANPLYCGWSAIDADGDGLTFEWTRDYENYLFGHSVSADGTANMSSASYYEPYGSPLTPDNYLVSPAITLGANNTEVVMRFMARSQDAEANREHFQLLISEDPQVFEDVLYEGDTVHEWVSYYADISEYIGKTVYIAFRHFDTTDMFYLNIDMLELLADGTVTVAETLPVYNDSPALGAALNIEGGEFTFHTGTLYPWTTDTDGVRTWAASTNHRPFSAGYIETIITVTEPCRLSFDWMNDAEEGFDYPTLYINYEEAVQLRAVNGEFVTEIIDIAEPGEYRIAWVFEKDDEISALSDAAYVDNVELLEAIPAESIVLEEMYSVACGSVTSVNYTLLPADTTNKTIIWSSSDESVAVVDENGIMTGVGMGRAVITASTFDGSVTAHALAVVTAPNDPQTFYGYRHMNSTGGRFDFVAFSEAELGSYTTLATINNPIFMAMEYYDGTIYGYGARAIYTMTIDDPTCQLLFNIELPDSSVSVVDMAYSYADNAMYMLLAASNTSAIYTLDLATGALAQHCVVTGMTVPGITLAISTDGTAYTIERYFGGLYEIDLDTGAATLIGNTGYEPAADQSMTYDHNNNRLVWALYCVNSESGITDGLVEIDPKTAATSWLGSVNEGFVTQLVGLFCVPEHEAESRTVEFIDGVTGGVIEARTVETGSVITAFPDAPAHAGFVFAGWTYDGSPVMANIQVFAQYALLGDVDGDGTVTTLDALLVMRYASGLGELDEAQLLVGDANGDGDVNMSDALLMLRTAMLGG